MSSERSKLDPLLKSWGLGSALDDSSNLQAVSRPKKRSNPGKRMEDLWREQVSSLTNTPVDSSSTHQSPDPTTTPSGTPLAPSSNGSEAKQTPTTRWLSDEEIIDITSRLVTTLSSAAQSGVSMSASTLSSTEPDPSSSNTASQTRLHAAFSLLCVLARRTGALSYLYAQLQGLDLENGNSSADYQKSSTDNTSSFQNRFPNIDVSEIRGWNTSYLASVVAGCVGAGASRTTGKELVPLQLITQAALSADDALATALHRHAMAQVWTCNKQCQEESQSSKSIDHQVVLPAVYFRWPQIHSGHVTVRRYERIMRMPPTVVEVELKEEVEENHEEEEGDEDEELSRLIELKSAGKLTDYEEEALMRRMMARVQQEASRHALVERGEGKGDGDGKEHLDAMKRITSALKTVGQMSDKMKVAMDMQEEGAGKESMVKDRQGGRRTTTKDKVRKAQTFNLPSVLSVLPPISDRLVQHMHSLVRPLLRRMADSHERARLCVVVTLGIVLMSLPSDIKPGDDAPSLWERSYRSPERGDELAIAMLGHDNDAKDEVEEDEEDREGLTDEEEDEAEQHGKLEEDDDAADSDDGLEVETTQLETKAKANPIGKRPREKARLLGKGRDSLDHPLRKAFYFLQRQSSSLSSTSSCFSSSSSTALQSAQGNGWLLKSQLPFVIPLLVLRLTNSSSLELLNYADEERLQQQQHQSDDYQGHPGESSSTVDQGLSANVKAIRGATVVERETSVDIRQLLLTLTHLLLMRTRREDSATHFRDFCHIAIACLVDADDDVRIMSAMLLLIPLCRLFPMEIRMYAPAFVNALLPSLTHKHVKLRSAALCALEILIHCGASNMLRTLAGFKESNVVVFKEYFEGQVRRNYFARMVEINAIPVDVLRTCPPVALITSSSSHSQSRTQPHNCSASWTSRAGRRMIRMLSGWMTCLRERADYETLIVPYLLALLPDEGTASDVFTASTHSSSSTSSSLAPSLRYVPCLLSPNASPSSLPHPSDKISSPYPLGLPAKMIAVRIGEPSVARILARLGRVHEADPYFTMQEEAQHLMNKVWHQSPLNLPSPDSSHSTASQTDCTTPGVGILLASSPHHASRWKHFLLPPPLRAPPSLGLSDIVNRHFGRMIQGLLSEAADWSSSTRARALAVLVDMTAMCGHQVAGYLFECIKVAPAIAQLINEQEARASAQWVAPVLASVGSREAPDSSSSLTQGSDSASIPEWKYPFWLFVVPNKHTSMTHATSSTSSSSSSSSSSTSSSSICVSHPPASPTFVRSFETPTDLWTPAAVVCEPHTTPDRPPLTPVRTSSVPALVESSSTLMHVWLQLLSRSASPLVLLCLLLQQLFNITPRTRAASVGAASASSGATNGGTDAFQGRVLVVMTQAIAAWTCDLFIERDTIERRNKLSSSSANPWWTEPQRIDGGSMCETAMTLVEMATSAQNSCSAQSQGNDGSVDLELSRLLRTATPSLHLHAVKVATALASLTVCLAAKKGRTVNEKSLEERTKDSAITSDARDVGLGKIRAARRVALWRRCERELAKTMGSRRTKEHGQDVGKGLATASAVGMVPTKDENADSKNGGNCGGVDDDGDDNDDDDDDEFVVPVGASLTSQTNTDVLGESKDNHGDDDDDDDEGDVTAEEVSVPPSILLAQRESALITSPSLLTHAQWLLLSQQRSVSLGHLLHLSYKLFKPPASTYHLAPSVVPTLRAATTTTRSIIPSGPLGDKLRDFCVSYYVSLISRSPLPSSPSRVADVVALSPSEQSTLMHQLLTRFPTPSSLSTTPYSRNPTWTSPLPPFPAYVLLSIAAAAATPLDPKATSNVYTDSVSPLVEASLVLDKGFARLSSSGSGPSLIGSSSDCVSLSHRVTGVWSPWSTHSIHRFVATQSVQPSLLSEADVVDVAYHLSCAIDILANQPPSPSQHASVSLDTLVESSITYQHSCSKTGKYSLFALPSPPDVLDHLQGAPNSQSPIHISEDSSYSSSSLRSAAAYLVIMLARSAGVSLRLTNPTDTSLPPLDETSSPTPTPTLGSSSSTSSTISSLPLFTLSSVDGLGNHIPKVRHLARHVLAAVLYVVNGYSQGTGLTTNGNVDWTQLRSNDVFEHHLRLSTTRAAGQMKAILDLVSKVKDQ